MRLVSIDKIEKGMIVGKKVYNNVGSILLYEDIVLTGDYIERLKNMNIPSLYIKDDISKGIEVDEIIDNELKIGTIITLEKEFEFLKNKDKKGKKLLPQKSYNKIKNVVEDILEQLLFSDSTLMNMTKLMSTDIYTYEHSVNVSILSMMIATELNFPKKKVIDIGLGAMLHDIGKMAIDEEVLFKAGRLSDEEFEHIKEHPVLGYEMVKDDRFISPIAKSIILLHHEKLDGSGYPRHLKGKDFNKLDHVKIVTAVDILDALINDRVYKKKMPVYEAVELVSSNVPMKIDSKIFDILKKKIEPYPTGSGVILTDGRIGLVEKNNYDNPTRPCIRIIYDEKGNELEEKKVINMMENLTVFIDDFYDL